MITMISVSSFKLTRSLTLCISPPPPPSLHTFLMGNSHFCCSLLFLNHLSIIQSLTHSLILSLCHLLPHPSAFPRLYLSVFSFASFPFEFPMLGAYTRLVDAWLFPQMKNTQSFPVHGKEREKEGEKSRRKRRKKIIIICLGKFISIHTAHTHTHILMMYLDVPILGVSKIIQIICQYILWAINCVFCRK